LFSLFKRSPSLTDTQALDHVPPLLPEIEWRINTRAKRLRLTIKAGRVWVTIPPRTSAALVHRFLDDSRPWLIEQWQKQQQHLQGLTPHPAHLSTPSGALTLPVLDQTWQLDIGSYSKLKSHDHILRVPDTHTSTHLRQWVKLQAQQYLPQRLAVLAEAHGFVYSGCTIRHARTRWGSCTRHGKINLNASLMLLPPALVDYVLLHELCHTRQFNHSPLFWQEMQSVCPEYIQSRHQIKTLALPAWWHQQHT